MLRCQAGFGAAFVSVMVSVVAAEVAGSGLSAPVGKAGG